MPLWLHGRPSSEKEASGKEASGPDPERVRPRPAEEPAGIGRQDTEPAVHRDDPRHVERGLAEGPQRVGLLLPSEERRKSIEQIPCGRGLSGSARGPPTIPLPAGTTNAFLSPRGRHSCVQLPHGTVRPRTAPVGTRLRPPSVQGGQEGWTKGIDARPSNTWLPLGRLTASGTDDRWRPHQKHSRRRREVNTRAARGRRRSELDGRAARRECQGVGE